MNHSAADGHAHPAHLAHHFETPDQQYASGKLGMWIFLATEILLFGGLFCAYAVYRSLHPEIFDYAHLYLNKILGGINTIVLICSSLTMAWGVRAAQLGQKKLLVWMLILTLLCGCGFLGIKYVEYKNKWEEGLLWGKRFAPTEPPPSLLNHGPHAHPAATPPAAKPAGPVDKGEDHSLIKPAAPGPKGLARETLGRKDQVLEAPPKNLHLFFGIYFVMTGLHGVHVIAGMCCIAWALRKATKGVFGPQYFTPVDLVGLYWHLVDLVWIFLFPLLYLIH